MVHIAECEFWRGVGLEKSVPSTFRDRLRHAERWFDANGRPWAASRFVAVDRLRFASDVLGRGFRAARVEQVLLVATSAGDRVDAQITRLFAEGRPDEGYFLAAYAEAVAAALRRQELGSTGVQLLPHYAPGYVGWDAGDLPALVDLLGDARGPLACGGGATLRPLRSTVVAAGAPTIEIENTHRYWDRFGGRTCTEVCRPCTCSMR